jgi:hypothetical protein
LTLPKWDNKTAKPITTENGFRFPNTLLPVVVQFEQGHRILIVGKEVLQSEAPVEGHQ